ncbi:cysteine-rich receptor-like protein kinase 25 [Chenopodium quinoa]|uniref:cysteine-rich receptor-like protein kinase 25 n=1 Tax=Chenopodium quinoa TaxID=63459 RepID=UPI000B77D2E6|nr:cysteine-rich receptor-like protein kinase 25 [Chenopodium quinoa]
MAWQSIISFALLLFTSLSFISFITATHPELIGLECDYSKGNNYIENSSYHLNLLSAFSNLTYFSSFNTFSNLTAGSDEDATNKVYALYDCRLDLTLQTCQDCIEDATKFLLKMCPLKESMAVYGECMLRYANRPIFAMMELRPSFIECVISTPDGGELNRTVEPIFTRLIDEVTSRNSAQYFAVGEGSYFEYQKVYCLVQCTPDISRVQCKECLMNALNYTLQCANSSSGLGSYHNGPSCQTRYGVFPFFDLSSSSRHPVQPTASPPISPQLRTSNIGVQIDQKLSYTLFISLLFTIWTLLKT